MMRRWKFNLDGTLERRKPGSPRPRPVSLAPFCRQEILCTCRALRSTLGSRSGAGMWFEADGSLPARECCQGDPQSSFRENVFPTVWPSALLTSRPAIRVSRSWERAPNMVLSVTVIRSENERAQPINRPCGPRNCTGRAPFSEKFSGDRKEHGSRPSGFKSGSLPTRVVRECAGPSASATSQ